MASPAAAKTEDTSQTLPRPSPPGEPSYILESTTCDIAYVQLADRVSLHIESTQPVEIVYEHTDGNRKVVNKLVLGVKQEASQGDVVPETPYQSQTIPS
ncbi:hypothetical protein NPN18_23400, partial [Vibrio parahaemolyticus]|nr:hypothetical protein [Vibrio parahaemolyticus]